MNVDWPGSCQIALPLVGKVIESRLPLASRPIHSFRTPRFLRRVLSNPGSGPDSYCSGSLTPSSPIYIRKSPHTGVASPKFCKSVVTSGERLSFSKIVVFEASSLWGEKMTENYCRLAEEVAQGVCWTTSTSCVRSQRGWPKSCWKRR